MSLLQSWGPSAKSLDVTKTISRLATGSTSQDPKTVDEKGFQYDNIKGLPKRSRPRPWDQLRIPGGFPLPWTREGGRMPLPAWPSPGSVCSSRNQPQAFGPRRWYRSLDIPVVPPSFRSRGAFKALPSSVADWQMPEMKRSLSREDTWGPKSHPSPPGVSHNRDILCTVGSSRLLLATLEEP